MVCAVISVFGAPGAGKTTFCDAFRHLLLDVFTEHSWNIASIIHFDNFEAPQKDVSNTIMPEFNSCAWKNARCSGMIYLDSIIRQHCENSSDTIILVDDTFHLRSMRKNLRSLSVKYGAINHFVFIDSSIATCCSRETNRFERKLKRKVTSASEAILTNERDYLVLHRLPENVILKNWTKLTDQCCNWRPSDSDGVVQTNPIVYYVPCSRRYKWESQENCHCWRLDGSSSPEELATCFIDQFLKVPTPALPQLSRTLANKTIYQDSVSDSITLTPAAQLNALDKALRNVVGKHYHFFRKDTDTYTIYGHKHHKTRKMIFKKYKAYFCSSTPLQDTEYAILQEAAVQELEQCFILFLSKT